MLLLALAAGAARADRTHVDAEPEAHVTYCERTAPQSVEQCVRELRQAEARLEARRRNPPPATTQDIVFGVISVVSPLAFVGWLLLSSRK